MKIAGGAYKPVAAMSHREVAAAIVAARTERPGEAVWQALCKRAELVAVSLTPAEIVAVARCVAERQAGQLRLMWKLAGAVVEKLPAFTADDLVCLAEVYASLEAVHRGMLNVVALVLMDEEDERTLTPMRAVKLLAAFSSAKYPLPLVVSEAKRVLTDTDVAGPSSVAGPPDLGGLSAAAALQALTSLADLGALDGRVLAALLPRALAEGPPTTAGVAPVPLPAACEACRWAVAAGERLRGLDEEPCLPFASSDPMLLASTTSEAASSSTASGMTGAEALAAVETAVRGSLEGFEPKHMRVSRVQGQEGVVCVVPSRDGQGSAVGVAESVDGEALLSAAELLAGPTAASSSSSAPAELLAGALGVGSAELWPLAQQVRWLRVAAGGMASAAPSEVLEPLLGALAERPPHKLLAHAPSLLGELLPALVLASDEARGVATSATALACLLAKECRQSLFRLALKDSHAAVHGCLRLAASLPVGQAAALRLEAAPLLKTAVQSLPAKFRAEAAFRQRQHEGTSSADVAAWCRLLADVELLAAAVGKEAAEAIGEDTWLHLSGEASQVIACGDIDDTAADLLGAFATEGRRRGWSVVDAASPLGVVAAAVRSEWARTTVRDGELEDALHEPLPVPEAAESRLRALFSELGIEAPPSAAALP